MRYVLANVEEGYTRNAAIFSPTQMETGVEAKRLLSVYPTTAIPDGGPIFFRIPGNSGDYIDTTDMRIRLEVKIVHPNGDAIAAGDDTTLANNPLHSMFKEVAVSYNNTNVNPDVGTLYPYKCMIDALVTDNMIKNSTKRRLEGYYDEPYADLTETSGIIALDGSNSPNTAVLKRHSFTSAGKACTLIGSMNVDFLNCPKLLVNGVDVNIVFYQSSDSFRLLAKDNTIQYRVKIVSMSLEVQMITLRGELLMAHTEEFAKNSLAHYPFTKVTMREFTLASGITQWDQSHVFSDAVPHKIIVGFVKSKNYAGAFDRNPFYFENLNITSGRFDVNGQSLPGEPFESDFNADEFSECLHNLIDAAARPEIMNLSMDGYKNGKTLFAFNVHDPLSKDAFPMIDLASTRLSFKFGAPLAESITVIVYMLGVGEFSISQARVVRPAMERV